MALLSLTKEALNLSDGTTLAIPRTPNLGDKEWEDYKKYLENNPEEARRMETFWKDAKQIRAWKQTESINEYYDKKRQQNDQVTTSKLATLESNPEFSYVFDDIKKGGSQAAMNHYYNEPLMVKISKAMGGLPDEVKTVLDEIETSAQTLQEACLKGDTKGLEAFLKATADDLTKRDIDGKDAKGVSCLGYAIGANRTAIVKLLLEANANPWEVDAYGCSGLHYAAAYGRKELLEYLISAGGTVNQKNTQGQTPLALAVKNKMKDTADLLKAKGGEL